MKKIALLAVFLYPLMIKAQTGTVKGKVIDTLDHRVLSLAVVSFLNATDSTLAGFARADQTGSFSKKISDGNYILLVTYPGYADFVYPLQVNNRDIDLREISLIPRAKLMESIIITQRSIRIKGDTTEYMADSFRVKPNATVEDLLRELPGIQVDKDGKITAQGQTVQKILVDGDEFFSDDPTIATRNLRADAIRKVQVFDKKSDQSAFTGIDDGNAQKTINLELKDDAKRGYFGKLSAAGLDRYYNLQAMINAFKAKRKLAAFGIASSTSETGLDWANAGNYGFNPNNVSADASTGSISINSKSGDEMGSGNYNGTGLPESIKAGIHYSNQWQGDKYDLASNYLFNNLKVRSRINDFSQYALQDSVFYNQQFSESNTSKLRHNLTASMEIQLDSSSSIVIDGNGYTGKEDFNVNSDNFNYSESHEVVNTSHSNWQSANTNGAESINVLYRKKLRRPGQTFSLNLSQDFSQVDEDGHLFNSSLFYDENGALSGKDTTDQKKNNSLMKQSYSANATFSQPLSGSSFLVFNYEFGIHNAQREQLSFNKNGSGKYEVLVDSLSNKFKYRYVTNTAGLNYRFVNKKVNLSFGGSISNTAFRQTNLYVDTSHNYNYLNFFPQVQFMYKFNSFNNIKFGYNGYTTQPTIDQVQPLVDNSDPLNLLIGNPGLKQSFTHSAQVTFSNFKILNERYLMLGARFILTQNEITTSYTIDPLGKRVSKYVNTNGNYATNIYGVLSFKIPKSDWRIGTGPILAIYRYSSFVNDLNNITNTANLSWRLKVDNHKVNSHDLTFIVQPSYRSSKSTISKVAKNGYWGSTFGVDGSLQLPLNFEIGTDFTMEVREKTAAFNTTNNVILWNAYLEKRFLKNQSLALRVSMHDILNQGKGYSRYEYDGAVQERNYLTFGQYGLIRLTYNFVNKGGKAPQSLGGTNIL